MRHFNNSNSHSIPSLRNGEETDQALNVTLLADEWGSSMGGLSTINRNLAINLAKHTQVHVTLFVPEGFCSEEEKIAAGSHNVAVRVAKRLPGFVEPRDWLIHPPSDLAIDVVFGHGVNLGKQAQLIRESHSCKWVQVVHTAPEELGIHKIYPKAISKGEEKNITEVGLCKLADVVVTIGPKLTGEYSSQLRAFKKHEDIIQLTPGILSEFSVVEQTPHEGAKFKVLIFGRGDPEDFRVKGYDIAAKAIAALKDNVYRLIFVGAPDGKQDQVAEALLQSRISKDQLIVRKFVKKEQLKALFSEVDLVVMPSRTEGFGLTALEALSAGLPILVSGNSGLGEALRSLRFGEPFVIESDDPKVWATRIAAVRRKDRRKRLEEVKKLRKCYDEKFSWEKQSSILVDKIRSIVHGRNILIEFCFHGQISCFVL